MNENGAREIGEYELYLEKISAIIHVPPEIGAILYIVEWYLVYVIVYLMSGSWIIGTKVFEILDIIPFIIALVVGWGLLYIRKSYINTSNKLKFLLKDTTYEELFNKMIRRRMAVITYVVFALFAIVCAIHSFFSQDGTTFHYQYGLAAKIFIVHNLIWYLVIGIPVLAELVSLIFGVVSFPYFISKGIQYDVISAIEPYRCGGLRPVGELCFSGGFVYFAGLTLYTALFYNLQIMNILVFIMWFVGLLIFLAPQYFVYKILNNYKINMLKEITSQINEESKLSNLICGKITEKNALSLFTLMILFTEVEKMHVYPFDLKTCRDFLFVAIIPLIINIISIFHR